MKYEQQNYAVKMFKVLSNANRLKIIHLLMESMDAELTVGNIADKLDIEANNVSNHLVRLRENGVLRAEQVGSNMFYQIRDERVAELIKLAIK